MMIPSDDKFEQVIIGSYVPAASTVFREVGWKQRRELSVPDEVTHSRVSVMAFVGPLSLDDLLKLVHLLSSHREKLYVLFDAGHIHSLLWCVSTQFLIY